MRSGLPSISAAERIDNARHDAGLFSEYLPSPCRIAGFPPGVIHVQQSAISVPGLNRIDPVGRTRTVLLFLLLIASAGYLAAGLADSWAMRGPALVNAGGMAVGRDFVTYWSAGNLALAGEPAAVFDVERLRAAEAAAVGARIGATPWFYPPTFLLLAATLASLPYPAALAASLILPTIGLSLLNRRMAPHP